ncbi:DUF3891 family protein [Persicimonas caeni]|uniref:DUF3891 family protein n=1 Tax=Persicimonas caeni TaxID=2292766 RepID=A0A4Y6PZE8_PERCE|nr:DUF3891 family protein [Persicimonas caeni]QDG53549.1 DUF3891 family protein [Persicimonas caeni]QED34770.1 DUF3891 family protein [Persicimonas caeni]
MLIRPTSDSTFECITQEHHAVLSGLLAGAWKPTRLDPLLVQAIGVHDNPWREADAQPLFNDDRGLPHDFITYPMEEKIALYRHGLDALEEVHPWIAHLVSRHYTTFSGTRDVDTLVGPERARRERLEGLIADWRLDASDEALRWVKFFDIFSLHLCLTGPRTQTDSIPRWLTDPDKWSTAPDGTELKLRWESDATLTVDPWPFAEPELDCGLYVRVLEGRAENAEEMERAWREAEVGRRGVRLQSLAS